MRMIRRKEAEKMNKEEANKKLFEEIDRFLYGNVRPEILPKPMPNYAHERSVYPEQIRISFSDGHTEIYERRIDQPHPVIIENIEIIRKWKQGYVNRPERRRRRK